MKKFYFIFLIFIFIGCFGTIVFADNSQEVKLNLTINELRTNSTANFANNKNQIVGFDDMQKCACIWDNFIKRNLHSLLDAYSINEKGQIVGQSLNANACLFENNNVYELDTRTSIAYSINEKNQIVGKYYGEDYDYNGCEAFLWDNGSMINLKYPRGSACACSINNDGQIVGYTDDGHAILWENGNVGAIDLGTLGGEGAFARSINDKGQIVGSVNMNWPQPTRGFLWENGNVHYIDSSENHSLYPTSINNNNQIVGIIGTDDGCRGFLWENGVLNDLGVNNLYNISINDNGLIVGSYYDKNNKAFNSFFTQSTNLGKPKMLSPKTINNECIKGIYAVDHTAILPIHKLDLTWSNVLPSLYYKLSIRDINTGDMILDNEMVSKDITSYLIDAVKFEGRLGHKCEVTVGAFNGEEDGQFIWSDPINVQIGIRSKKYGNFGYLEYVDTYYNYDTDIYTIPEAKDGRSITLDPLWEKDNLTDITVSIPNFEHAHIVIDDKTYDVPVYENGKIKLSNTHKTRTFKVNKKAIRAFYNAFGMATFVSDDSERALSTAFKKYYDSNTENIINNAGDWTFNPRHIAVDPKSTISPHSWGIAVDVNSGDPLNAFKKSTHSESNKILYEQAFGPNKFKWLKDYDSMHFQLESNYENTATVINIRCPVNIEVYDMNDNLVEPYKTSLNEEDYGDENSKYTLMDYSDEKYAFLDNDEYKIKLIGTDNGYMNYTLYRYDEDNNLLKTIRYSNVEIDPNTTIYTSTNTTSSKLDIDKNKDGSIEKSLLPSGEYYGNEIPKNNYPTADAGPDQIVEALNPVETEVTLDGKNSSDPNGDTLTYTWSGLSGNVIGANAKIYLPFGKHTIILTVSDGIVESTDEVIINVVDTILPEITGNITTQPNSNDWYKTDVTIHFSATDSGSGIDSITPDIILSSEGTNQSVTGTATDKAGNSNSIKISGINIDKIRPEISDTLTQTYLLGDNLKLEFNATDAVSGIQKTYVKFNGVQYENGTIVKLTAYGDNIIELIAEDKAGNIQTISKTIRVQVPVDIKLDHNLLEDSDRVKGLTNVVLTFPKDIVFNKIKPDTIKLDGKYLPVVDGNIKIKDKNKDGRIEIKLKFRRIDVIKALFESDGNISISGCTDKFEFLGSVCDTNVFLIEELQNFINYISDINIKKEIKRTLIARLNSAIEALEKHKNGLAIKKLEKFINRIEKLKDKKITEEDVLLLQFNGFFRTFGDTLFSK